MKIPTPVLVFAFLLLGLLCGMAGRHFMPAGDSERPSRDVSSAPGAKPVAESIVTAKMRSSDAVETLLALDERQLYARPALWLLDTTVEELTEFRNTYQQAVSKDHEIGRLTLVHWARLNPQAAVAISSEGEQESYERWQAFAIHDPEAALAADAAAGGKMNRCIWNAIDQPDKALEIADEILSGRSGIPNRPEVRFADGTTAAFSSEDHLET